MKSVMMVPEASQHVFTSDSSAKWLHLFKSKTEVFDNLRPKFVASINQQINQSGIMLHLAEHFRQ